MGGVCDQVILNEAQCSHGVMAIGALCDNV